MNRILRSIFAVSICFSVGYALQCYKCDLGIGSLCFTTKTTCAAGEQCFSGVGKAAGFIDIMTKGCLPVAECNKTTSTNFPASSNTTAYQLTKTCCGYDLCNSAPGLPHVSILPLVLGSLITVFMTKALM